MAATPSNLAIEAFIKESVTNPTAAMEVIYFVAEYQTGLLGDPLNVIDFEMAICKRPSVIGFLSNYLATYSLLLMENDSSFEACVQTIAKAIVPTSLDGGPGGFQFGGDPVFAKARFGPVDQLMKVLQCNPFTACVAILRINIEKLLLLVHCLGPYKTEFEARPQQAS